MRHAEDQRLFTEENQERKNGLPDIRQVQETLKLLPDERIQQIFLPLLQEGVYPWDEEMAKRLTMVKNPSYHKYRDEDKAIKRYEERINNGRKGVEPPGITVGTMQARDLFYRDIYQTITGEDLQGSLGLEKANIYRPEFREMTDLIEQLTAVQSHNKNDREPIQGLRKDSWLQNILDAYGNPYAWDLMKEYLQGEVNYLRGIKMLAKTYNLVIPLEDPIDEYMYEHNQHSIAEIAIDETIQRMYDTFERIHKHDTQEEYDKNVYVKSDVTEKAREMHKKIYEFSEEITPKETIYLDDGTSYESPLGGRVFLCALMSELSIGTMQKKMKMLNYIQDQLIQYTQANKLHRREGSPHTQFLFDEPFLFEGEPFFVERTNSAKGRGFKFRPLEFGRPRPMKSETSDSLGQEELSGEEGPKESVKIQSTDILPPKTIYPQSAGTIPIEVKVNDRSAKSSPELKGEQQDMHTSQGTVRQIPEDLPSRGENDLPKEQDGNPAVAGSEQSTEKNRKIILNLDPVEIDKSGAVLDTEKNKDIFKRYDNLLKKDPRNTIILGKDDAGPDPRGDQIAKNIREIFTTTEGRTKMGLEGPDPDKGQVTFKYEASPSEELAPSSTLEGPAPEPAKHTETPISDDLSPPSTEETAAQEADPTDEASPTGEEVLPASSGGAMFTTPPSETSGEQQPDLSMSASSEGDENGTFFTPPAQEVTTEDTITSPVPSADSKSPPAQATVPKGE